MKKKEQKSSSSKILILILVAFIFYVSYTLYSQEKQLDMLKEQEEHIIEVKKKKEEEIQELKKQIANADSPEYVEKYARESLKMVMDEDIVYVDVNKKNEEKN